MLVYVKFFKIQWIREGLVPILRNRITIAALTLLLIFSFPVTALLIWGGLETNYPHRPVQELRNHKAVVVLGGMLGGFETVDGIVIHRDFL